MRRMFLLVLVVILLMMLLACKSKKHGDCDAYGSTNKTTQHDNKNNTR